MRWRIQLDKKQSVSKQDALIKSGVVICPIDKAKNRYRLIIEQYFSDIENDIIDDNKTIFVYIPKNFSLSIPLFLPDYFADYPDISGFSSILIYADNNSRSIIIEDYQSKKYDKDLTVVKKVVLEKDAKLSYLILQDISRDACLNCNTKTVLNKNADLNWINIEFGGRTTRQNLLFELDGASSKANISTLFLADNNQCFDILVNVVHNVKNTRSRVILKGAALGSSKALYKGIINIKEKARNCNGILKEEALLLSEQAEIESIPVLYVNNDDVKCNHSASISQINKEKLFYLQSRGLDDKSARQIIVHGFFRSILDELDAEAIDAEAIGAESIDAENIDNHLIRKTIENINKIIKQKMS